MTAKKKANEWQGYRRVLNVRTACTQAGAPRSQWSLSVFGTRRARRAVVATSATVPVDNVCEFVFGGAKGTYEEEHIIPIDSRP